MRYYHHIMSKAEKLLEKVRNNPQGVRFEELCKLAEALDFRYKGGKGSHKTYTREDVFEILNF